MKTNNKKRTQKSYPSLAQQKQVIKQVMQEFHKGGMETGRKIEEVAKKIHPDCILTIPLYRSCVVILKQDKKEKERGYCTILLYHDPQWRSEKITKETLQYYKDELVLHGQRSGFELWLNKGVLNVDIKETIEEIMEEK